MKDTNETYGDAVWYMDAVDHGNKITRYSSELDLKNNNPDLTLTLPLVCTGNQPVIFNGHLYCQDGRRQGKTFLIKINLESNNLERKVLIAKTGDSTVSQSGSISSCDYSYGTYGAVDFAVDEQGLWLIHGNFNGSFCQLQLSKLDPNDLTITKTWTIGNINKRKIGNAFMKCGVLYMINYHDIPIYIKYKFDTATNNLETLNRPIPFETKLGREVDYLAYNPRDQSVYVWYFYNTNIRRYKLMPQLGQNTV